MTATQMAVSLNTSLFIFFCSLSSAPNIADKPIKIKISAQILHLSSSLMGGFFVFLKMVITGKDVLNHYYQAIHLFCSFFGDANVLWTACL
jgi:hypothetical protein